MLIKKSKRKIIFLKKGGGRASEIRQTWGGACPKRLKTPGLKHGRANSALPGQFPSEFSANPIQTHLNQLIIVFKTTRRLQAGEFYQGWIKSLQESGLEGPSLPITGLKELNYKNQRDFP